jgi:hypothetical protein
MKDGFIKVAAATPDIEVGNTAFNTEHILSCMQQAQGTCETSGIPGALYLGLYL